MRDHQELKKTLLFTILIVSSVGVSLAKPMQNETAIVSDNEFEAYLYKPNTIASASAESEYRAEYAKLMMTYMNQSVNPCDDFYEYACGNWKNVIQDRQAKHKRSNLLDIVYQLVDAVENLLQTSADNLELHEYASQWKLAQQFYNSCISADLYPIKRSEVYLKELELIGGFPAVSGENWNPDEFSWFNMSAYMRNYGFMGLTNEEIIPQYPFPPYFKLPELGFDYFVHSDNIASNTSRGYTLNEKRMREFLTAYGVEESNATKIITDIFEFWHAVLNVVDKFDEDVNKCLELSDTDTFTQWDDYFTIAWNGIDFNVTEDDCPCDYFYVKLDSICEEHKEAVANYLALKFLYHMHGIDEAKYQKDFCIIKIQYALPYLVDRLYLHEHFSAEIHDEVASIVKEIRTSLRVILEAADWLDQSTRAEALMKESTIISRIGKFKNVEMTERLIGEMNNLTFVEDNYEQNNINLKKFKTFMKRYNGFYHEQLENDAKPLELLIAMQVNAFYYNIDNSINVMAGILHPPAYHKAWPNSLKYGTLGYLIGHEFTHGFDSTGALFDSDGADRYWWSKKSGKVFDERASCYVNHFNNYTIPEIKRNINGEQTKDENIADSGGLREALSAYRRLIKESIKDSEQTLLFKDEKMPGLDLSPEQLFFLGFAQVWCAAYKEEHYWEELSNEHTVDKYRVLGALTNYDDFAKTYECPIGTKMNPNEEKCRVW